jgi:hypothetical protein
MLNPVKNNGENMKSMAIELARFRIKEGIAEEAFQSLIRETNEVLSTYRGFVSRRVGRTVDGEYFDIVEWEDLEAATTAAGTFGKDARSQPFIEALDFTWKDNWLKHLNTISVFPLS